jgi:hypothetical protein
MREIASSIHSLTDEMTSMVFGRQLISQRDRRQFVELALIAIEVVNFGITLKNSYDIARFREQMATVESRIDGLIHLNDEIVKSQLRDHKTISRLLNTTLV